MPERCLVHWHRGERLPSIQRLLYCQRPAQPSGLCEYHQRDKGAPGACRCDLDEARARITAGLLAQMHKEV